MIRNEALNNVFHQLLTRDLGEAIVAMENYLAVHPHQINSDRLHAIRTDYQLMADYWRHGFRDPQLPTLYDNLLKRMYVLYANIASNYTIRHTPYLSAILFKSHVSVRDWSPSVIREELESFVSDVAMLGLEPPHTAEPKRKELYVRHHQSMVELFDYILTSNLWTDSFASAMEDILLSPTIDVNDQQLIVSCVMLSSMSYFDIAKFRMLVHVYQQATDEQVRQRALIGWVFSLDADMGRCIYSEEEHLVKGLLEDKHCCEELAELQRQLIYCISAEQDNATIQREIIPNLVKPNKNSDSPISINWMNEEDMDQLNDILHPNEAEERLERMENSYKKMVDMQRQGSDIYFGGFSQMKRYPFFNELLNWFVPFYFDHPEVNGISDKYRNNGFLRSMMKNGPFCNSDKYSFMLAFESVINTVPEGIRKMLDRGEGQLAMQEMAGQDLQEPAYLRRLYLQDLYRFFRLNPQRDAFRNIFNPQEKEYLFFTSEIFYDTPLQRYYNEITAFLIKKKRLDDARLMLKHYDQDNRDFQYYMMSGYLCDSKISYYAKAIELEPENERALSGYARSLFQQKDFGQAMEIYEKLLVLQPEKKAYLLSRAVCQTELHQYEEAEKILFRLNYEMPDDENVNRVLAWTLTCNGKYEQAGRLYSQLLSVEEPSTDDILNYGYCLWFDGKIDDAADCFRRYLKETGASKDTIIKNETELLCEKGITEAELQMMLYIL